MKLPLSVFQHSVITYVICPWQKKWKVKTISKIHLFNICSLKKRQKRLLTQKHEGEKENLDK